MAKKNKDKKADKPKIQVTPKSTADKPGQSGKAAAKAAKKAEKKAANKAAKKEARQEKKQARAERKANNPRYGSQKDQVEDPTQLPLWDAYQRAVAQGKERQFLNQHPKFAARAGATKPAKPGLGKINSDETKIKPLVNVSERENAQQAQAATQAQNVQQVTTDTGTAGGFIDPATGRYVMYSEATPEQKAILEQGQQLTSAGQKAAAQNLADYETFDAKAATKAAPKFKSGAPEIDTFKGGNAGQIGSFSGVAQQGTFGAGKNAGMTSNALIGDYSKFKQTGSEEERARIEKAVYDRLTKNVDRDFNQEFEDMEQRMYNRGIPLDPSNPAYKREADALNEKYQSIKAEAGQRATEIGGEELQRSYGMGLQSHQQQMSDIESMYDLAQEAYNTRQSAQAQTFGQKQDTFETNLGAQAQRFGQAQSKFQTNLGAQGQEFGQDLSAYQAQLQGGQQGFQQGLQEHQQGMADTAAMQQYGTGYQGAPQLDFNAPDYQQVDVPGLWLDRRGQNITKYGIDKQYEAAMAGIEAGEEEEEPVDDGSGLP